VVRRPAPDKNAPAPAPTPPDPRAPPEPAPFLHDGDVVDLGTAGETVVLTPSEQRDLARLSTLLVDYQRTTGTQFGSLNPLDVANEWLRWEWEHRWPKRPTWLARRLHGEVPPQVVDDEE